MQRFPDHHKQQPLWYEVPYARSNHVQLHGSMVPFILKDERTIPKEKELEHFIGVDMGIKNIATVVVQDTQGNILDTQFFLGSYTLRKSAVDFASFAEN